MRQALGMVETKGLVALFEELLKREYPRGAAAWMEGVNRRQFLKLMAASLLTAEPLTLSNMPRLADVRAMAELLRIGGVFELVVSVVELLLVHVQPDQRPLRA